MKYRIEIWINKLSINSKTICFYNIYQINSRFIIRPKVDYISKQQLINYICN